MESVDGVQVPIVASCCGDPMLEAQDETGQCWFACLHCYCAYELIEAELPN